MSMPNWLNDAPPFQPTDNGAFNPGSNDPSMGFMPTPTTTSYDFTQLQNQQLQQRIQNGIPRNGSPAYNNPMYQTQNLIPAKRPRPREDSIGASPQPNSGALPGSRSQTPQGPYPGFPGAVNGGHQFSGTTSYQQYQQAGNNLSHSPVMQGQSYNTQVPHQRIQTMSPSPFSPATQNFATQASPPQSEHGSRVNTPQNGVSHYAQAMPYAGTPSQPFTPPPGAANGAALAQYNQHLQNQQHQQRVNEARVRALQQQQRQQALNPLAQQQPNPMSMHNVAAMRAQQAQQRTPGNPEQLLRTITQWAEAHGQTFNPHLSIMGVTVSAVQLFIGVVKMGGSKRVTAQQQWPNVAVFLGFPPAQGMAVAQQLHRYWNENLEAYETWFQQQQQQRRAMADPARVAGHPQGGATVLRQGAFSPNKQMHSQQVQQPIQGPSSMYQYQTPPKHMNPQQHDARQPLQNGYTAQQAPSRPSNTYTTAQPSMQAPPRSRAVQAAERAAEIHKEAERKKTDPWPSKCPIGEVYSPKVTFQAGETPRTYGGLQVLPNSNFLHTVDELLKHKGNAPKLAELGIIDIRALTLSLRSGIHAEVRLALDTLATLSNDATPIALSECEDLLETLIDCADDQVQLLADHSAEVSDAMLINSYEETIRGCKIENATLQDISVFGTLEYDLDRAADRLICITTILRNLSFLDSNHAPLADAIVVRFMSTVIRYIGTRSMVLRTHHNLLDFSKDIITFLTNVSDKIDLSGKEEALCILHFLLSFAPSPPPNSTEEGPITFAPYVPLIHRYYPFAVDSLAKLLARGDPNRSFYKSLFAADSTSTPSFDLLTRTFGLAIAAIPEVGPTVHRSLKVRAPFLIQGLLAGEILATYIPASEHELARSWLASQDGFALSLLRISVDFGKVPHQPIRHHSGKLIDPDAEGFITMTERGFALLRRLIEKAKDVNGSGLGIPPGVLPDKRTVVSTMVAPIPKGDNHVIRQLCALSSLDN